MQNQRNECLTMSVDSAARLLGISRGLAYEMVRQSKIPALHFGRIIRIPRYALESLLNAQGTGGRTEEIAELVNQFTGEANGNP